MYTPAISSLKINIINNSIVLIFVMTLIGHGMDQLEVIIFDCYMALVYL